MTTYADTADREMMVSVVSIWPKLGGSESRRMGFGMEDLDPERQKLLSDKLGRLLNWQPPQLTKTVGPFFPEAFDEFDRLRKATIARCQHFLAAYSDEQIALLRGRRSKDHADLFRIWDAFAAGEISRLRNSRPSWWAGGLGHQDFVADFDYWARMPHFTVPEAVSLSVGLDPRQTNDQFYYDLDRNRDAKLDDVMRFLIGRFDLVVRHFDPGQRGWKLSPIAFIKWVDEFAVEVPDTFLAKLRQFHTVKSTDAHETTEAEREDKREIRKLAELVIVMAIDGYRYDPGAPRSDVPKLLSDEAAKLGISIHPDTVRKHLKKSAELLPPGWKPE
jgi:hypothetical protein